MSAVVVQYNPSGRMGNRMFQYAFGYILSKKGNKNIIHDELPNFGIPRNHEQVAAKGKVISTYQKWGENYADMDLLLNHPGDIIVNSFLQKSCYYKEHRDLLREAFGIKQIDTINKDCLVVHIRETDYIEINSFLGYDYYKSLINDSGFTKIKIITDNSNCDTVDRLVNEGCELVTAGYVDKFEFHSNKRSIGDFKTLLYSENIALSQSSFSWWAAFLGYHKKIIFPFSTKVKMWPINPSKDDVDLYFDFSGEATKYIL
tara:strand:+ start:757 stop:1533 length:777 start_codon:yes stop_codon:yes gene_type:complete